MEAHFLQKLEKIVIDNLANEQFGVEELATEVSLSRFQVHRKVRWLTGKSVSQFIKEVRLKQSLKLLQETDFTISELSYRVGFGSPSYFTKCFSEYYGYTPGEIKRKSNDEIRKRINNSGRSSSEKKMYSIYDAWHELKRRKILNASLSFLLLSWLIIQMLKIAEGIFHFSSWITPAVFILLLTGFPISLYLSWHYEYKSNEFIKIQARTDHTKINQTDIQRPFTSLTIIFVIIVSLVLTYIVPGSIGQTTHEHELKAIANKKSIAVLPFVNISGDSSVQYFADGIKESIEDYLSRINEINVSSRTSTEQYRHQPFNYSKIARELDVTYLLVGNILYLNDSIRITTRIVDAGQDKILWSQQYTQTFKAQFSIMTKIAGDIAESLDIKLTANEVRMQNNSRKFRFSAHDYYMQGREFYKYYLSNFQNNNLQHASVFYKKALVEDSTFAPAYVGLGEICKAKRGLWLFSSIHQKEYTDSIGHFAGIALMFDPGLASAWSLQGEYYMFIDQTDQAIQALQKAISLQPNLTESYMHLGKIWLHAKHDPVKAFNYCIRSMYYEKNGPLLSEILRFLMVIYTTTGDYGKAEEMAVRNSELHPDMISYSLPIAFIKIEQGKFDEAKIFMDSVCSNETQDGCRFFYAMIYTFTQQFDLAIPLLSVRDSFGIAPPSPIKRLPANHLLGYCYLKTGRNREALEIFEIVEKHYINENDTWMLAEVYAEFGEHEKSLRMLLQLENENPVHSRFEFIRHLHTFKPLHENPVFKSLIQRVDNRKATYRNQIQIVENGDWYQSTIIQ